VPVGAIARTTSTSSGTRRRLDPRYLITRRPGGRRARSVAALPEPRGDLADEERVEAQVARQRVELAGVEPHAVLAAPVQVDPVVLLDLHLGAAHRAAEAAIGVDRRAQLPAEHVGERP